MWNDRQIAVETNYKANNILHVLYFYIFYIFLWLPSVAELNVGDSYIPIKISNQYLIERPKKVWSTKVWTKSTSSRAITQPKIIRPERNSNLNCNSSRFSHTPTIKSISQGTPKKSSDNLKFEQKIQVQGSYLSQ